MAGTATAVQEYVNVLLNKNNLSRKKKMSKIIALFLYYTIVTFMHAGIGRCRDHGNIANGRRVLEGTRENDTVHFMCNEGYLLYGNRQVSCGKDGSWTGDWPECTKSMSPIVSFMLQILNVCLFTRLFCCDDNLSV